MSDIQRQRVRARRRGIVVVIALLAVLAIFGVVFKGYWDQRVRSAYDQSQEVYTPAPKKQPKVALWIGDSYSAGAGASDVSKRFTSIVSRKLGWIEINVARGGTGYLAGNSTGQTSGKAACGKDVCPNYVDVLDQLGAYRPDIIVVSGGRNDPLGEGSNAIQSARNFYKKLAEQYPKQRVIVTLPILALEEETPEFKNFKSAVRYWAQYYGASCLDLGEPLFGKPDLLAADLVHPNDAGHAALAEKFIKVYKSKK
ncbi:MAG: hypothetical protein RL719_1129 [Actinomycetota bacterium]|jgi:lysophospholipase L1-like esterase